MNGATTFAEILKSRLAAKPELVTLQEAHPVDKLPSAIKEEIRCGYGAADAVHRAAVSIMNAAVAEQKLAFVLSRRVLKRLLDSDPNFKEGFKKPSLTHNSTTYSGVLSFLRDVGFEQVVEGNGMRPSVWSVPESLGVVIKISMYEEVRRVQLEACVSFVEKIDPTTGASTSRTTTGTRVGTESPSPIVSKTPSQQDTYSPKGKTGEDVVQSSAGPVLSRKENKRTSTSIPVRKDKASQKDVLEVPSSVPVAVAQANPSVNSIFSSWVSKTGILKANKSQDDFYSRRLPELRLLMNMLGQQGFTQVDLPADLERRATSFWLPTGHHPQAKELTSKDWNTAIQMLPDDVDEM